MHFHLPKPLHGWREFAGEVAIIVIGVLIALGAEQVVDEIGWRAKVRNAESAIKEEIETNAVNMSERIAVQQCLRQQIANLADQLNKGQSQWKAAPVVLNSRAMIKNGGAGPVLVPAYRPPSRLWFDDQWASARADGTLTHVPFQRAGGYESFYRGVVEMGTLQMEEASAASKLSYLASDRTLSETDRAGMFAALADVDRANSLMALVSTQALQGIASMHLRFDPDEVDGDSKRSITYERDLRGSCVHPVQLQLN